jgi:glycosyltransferase involved in cell wall biosynthesis
LRILLVANGFPPTAYGGVEVYAYDLARSLAQFGHTVSVFCRESQHLTPDFQLVREQVEGISVYRLINDYKALDDFSGTYWGPLVEEQFSSVLQEVKPDLVHFNHLIALSVGLPEIVRQARIPSIVTLHDYWPICARVNLIDWRGRNCPGPDHGGNCVVCMQGGKTSLKIRLIAGLKTLLPWNLRTWFRRKLLQRTSTNYLARLNSQMFIDRQEAFFRDILLSDLIFTPSNFVRDQYIQNGYPEDRIEVLPLGIDYPEAMIEEPLSSITQYPIRLAYIGSIIPIKGLHILLKALRRLNDDRICLDIYGREDAGSPNYIHSIHQLAKNDPRITFKGPFLPSEKNRVYQRIDALIIPSIAPETFSLVAREALASKKPVLAANIGALPEIITHGVNGYLFEAGDEVDLFRLLRGIIQGAFPLDSLSVPGHVPILSIKDHTKQLEKIYLRLVDL